MEIYSTNHSVLKLHNRSLLYVKGTEEEEVMQLQEIKGKYDWLHAQLISPRRLIWGIMGNDLIQRLLIGND